MGASVIRGRYRVNGFDLDTQVSIRSGEPREYLHLKDKDLTISVYFFNMKTTRQRNYKNITSFYKKQKGIKESQIAKNHRAMMEHFYYEDFKANREKEEEYIEELIGQPIEEIKENAKKDILEQYSKLIIDLKEDD